MRCVCGGIVTLLVAILTSVQTSNHCSSSHDHEIQVISAIPAILNMSSDSYAADSTCEWLLVAPSPEFIIKVNIIYLDTECSWDRLYLYDGRSFRDKLLGVYSGTLLPRPVYATSGAMLIYFFSDYDGTDKGFILQFSLVSTASDGISPHGSIGSCSFDSQCQSINRNSLCDKQTSWCDCETGATGVYCTGPTNSWQLMSAGDPAVSRAGHRVVQLLDAVYLYGGYDYTSTTEVSQLYRSTDMINFQLLQPTDSPAGRYSHQMVVQREGLQLYLDYGVASSSETFGEDALFVHGGTFYNGTITNELWTFSVYSNQWLRLPPSPLALAHHVMVVVDNRWLFIHGGRTDTSEDNPTSDMYIYDSKQQSWRKVIYQHGYEPSLRLAGHTAVHHNYLLYVYGGYTQRSARFQQVSDRLWKYDIRRRIWSKLLVSDTGLGRYGLVFHAATLYNNRLYIYGGKKESTDQCTNEHIYVFDLDCQEWLRTQASNTSGLHRSLGQHGHDMLMSQHERKDRLYVYGGVQGSLTSDVIAIDISSLQAQSVRSQCDRCHAQTTCASCVLTDRCQWCAAEKACRAEDRVCDEIYWGDNLALSNLTSCLTADSPAGWFYFVYKFPVNYSQPDEVHLSTMSKIEWGLSEHDFVCLDCESQLIARGYFYEMPEQPPNELRFTARRNRAYVYSVGTDGREVVLGQLQLSIAPKTDSVSRNDVVFGDMSGYIQYKAYQIPIEAHKSTANVGLIGNFMNTGGFSLEHLKPYTAGDCSLHTNCMLCSSDSLCGWCSSQSTCLIRTSSACNKGSDWLLTEPVYCHNCTLYTSCLSCTQSSANCEWLTDIHKCVRRGRSDVSIRSPQACHQPCTLRSNCTTCLQTVDECIWCTTLSVCLPMDTYQLDYQYGECLHFQSSVPQAGDACVDCSTLTSCKECSDGFFCGWCSHNANPSIGVCIPGDFSGPHDGQMCSQAIEMEYDQVGEASWSFRKCPDLLECSLGTHDCVQNADCIENLHSYECRCSRGYTGIGNDSCKETCYHECIHGNCISVNETGQLEFRCECNLGWRGDACDTNCGCNFHSTCKVAAGQCDNCLHYTTGDYCDECEANSYGNPSYLSGCTPCRCNGHGDPAGHCDSLTGVCNCIDMTTGHDCNQCIPGYFGDPRDGGECFRCYHGRMVVTNITGSDNYGSRYCHRGVQLTGTSTFQWLFRADNTQRNDNFTIVFVLLALDDRNPNPVYIFDHEPNTLLNESGALAILTKKDIGSAVSSSTGVMSVVHYARASADEAMLRFSVSERGCPHSCTGDSSLCSTDNSCVCSPGYIGADCQTKLDCTTQANITRCGTITTPHVSARSKSAISENSQAMYIHGGVTASGSVLDSLLLVSKDSLSLSSPAVTGDVPTARYGHAMECTDNSCYMYGGITVAATGSLALHQYKLSSGHPLYISSQFFHLSLNSTPLNWSLLENKVVPALTGHTLTYTSHSNDIELVLVGGMTEEVIWNPNVYVYNNSKWYMLSTSGARPQGLVGHSTVYRPSVNALYVVPGYLPEDSGNVEKSFYILDLASSVWSRRLYTLAPRTSHYLFPVSDRYLAMIGGYYSDADAVSDKAVDSRSSLYVYDTACDRWHTWWSPTSLTGSIDRENIIGYSYIEPTMSMEGVLLIVSSDDSVTLISTAAIREDFCGVSSNGTLLATGELCSPAKSTQKCSTDPMYCEAIDTCDLCTSTLPDYENLPSVCVWSDTQGSCLRRNSGSVAADEDVKCTTDVCRIHSSCLSCTRTPRCQWISDADRMQYASCTPTTTKLRYISSPDECPAMSTTLTCYSCLSNDYRLSPPIYTHTSVSYLWSLNQQNCMVTDLAAILDISHIGNVVDSHNSCLKSCSEYTQCITCLSQPQCGWCSVAESSLGIGLCMEGTRNSSDECVVETLRHGLEMEVVNARWNYAKCPEENECINNHHTCDLKVQKCVDELVGFTCECREGYRPVSLISDAERRQLCSSSRALPATDPDGGAICVPICQAGCGEHGCCLDDNTCQCNLGYVGEQCEKECDCHGHSNCPANDLSSCDSCLHNTTGTRCELCQRGYVGDPTTGEDCVSCFDTCNQRSDTCENSKATGPSRLNGVTLNNVKCNCTDNSEGNRCESCKSGYFNSENNTCTPCRCNGHGESGTCNPETGTNCVCRNNTMSSTNKHNTQCDECIRDYTGIPTDNHQCYKIVNIQHTICLDNTSSTECNALASGQASYYVLKLINGHRVDVRLTFDITQGAADIYISESSSTFIVTYDPVLDEHIVTFDQSYESTDADGLTKYRKKRATSDSEDSVLIPSSIHMEEEDNEGKYASYHHFTKGESLLSVYGLSVVSVLKLTNVRYRAVVIFPKDGLKIERFYVLVKSRETYTAGILKFTQYGPKIEIFAFINVFSSGLLLFLCAVAIGKKMRELQLIRQLQAVREVQLHAMADRPFSTTMMCMDMDSRVLGGACNVPFNVVPLALEPIRNSSAVVATTFMLLPGDETRPMKAAMASTILTWRLSFPAASKSKARSRADTVVTTETVL